jgi:selenocysteine lyase/cysteine desulfurase
MAGMSRDLGLPREPVPRALHGSAALDSQRALFDIPEGVTYLNCANMSPQPRAVTAAGVAAVRAKAAPWTVAAPDWFSGAERLRDVFARLVNADADGVALVPSVSYGIATAAVNVKVARGQSILLLDREFPSNVYAWRQLARRRRAEIRTVQRRPGGTWSEAVLEAIDADTAVVAVPNCHWTDGSLIDLTRVGRAARSAGAALVVDASQSLGAYPLDVHDVRPDFLVTVGYKWLMGPYGLGYLYVAPQWRERGVPLEQSWLARAGSEDFARLLDYTDAYRVGARRFDMGEFPQFVLVPMAIAALEQIRAWGVERIQQTLSILVSHVASEAVNIGASTVDAAERMGHLTGIRLAGGLPHGLAGALAEAQVYVSIRGDSVRVAPHLYNDRSDIDRFLVVLRQYASRATRLPRARDAQRGGAPA